MVDIQKHFEEGENRFFAMKKSKMSYRKAVASIDTMYKTDKFN